MGSQADDQDLMMNKIKQMKDDLLTPFSQWTDKWFRRGFLIVGLILVYLIITSEFTLIGRDESTGKVVYGQFSPSKVLKQANATNSISYGHSLDGTIDITYSKQFINLKVIKLELGVGVQQRPGESPVPRFQINNSIFFLTKVLIFPSPVDILETLPQAH